MAYLHCTDCNSVWDADELEPAEHMTGLDGYHCPECDEGQVMMPLDDLTTEIRRLATLIRETSAARGVDAWAVEEQGYSASEWAEMTGRDRSTVSRNVRRASAANQ